MFVNIANRCYVLGIRLFLDSGPDGLPDTSNSVASEEDRLELMTIMKTFSIVSTDNTGIRDQEGFTDATLELISVAECLMDVVPSDLFAKFQRFLEFIIEQFVDKLSMPSGSNNHMLHILYRIRQMENS